MLCPSVALVINFLVKGSKTYITNATEAKVFLVYAKVDVCHNTTKDSPMLVSYLFFLQGKVTAFLVDRDTPGFSTSKKIDKCGVSIEDNNYM